MLEDFFFETPWPVSKLGLRLFFLRKLHILRYLRITAKGIMFEIILGSLSERGFETRTATGREHFAC